MTEHIQKTIDLVKGEIEKLEEALSQKKKLANQLCELAGRPAIYAVTEERTTSLAAIRSDTFYGRSLFTCLREYLEMRRAAGINAASQSEIIQALQAGGFDFKAISSDEEAAKRAVPITLAKNSTVFHRLPNGDWGLLAWYPDIKAKKVKDANGKAKQQPELTPAAGPELTPAAAAEPSSEFQASDDKGSK